MENREIPLDITKPIKLTSNWFDSVKGNTYIPGIYQPNEIPVKAWSSKYAYPIEETTIEVQVLRVPETAIEIETKPLLPDAPTLNPVPEREIKHVRSKIKE
jgi:hypothetical protein